MPKAASAASIGTPIPSPAGHDHVSTVSRTCLFLLPILAVLGPHLGGVEAFGVTFFPYRIAVLAIALTSLALLPRLPWTRNRHMAYYLLLGCVWTVWALLGVLWARSQIAALRGAFAVAFGFLAFLAVANLESWKPHALRWLLRGWVAAAGVVAAVAIWELVTGNHLPGTWFASRPRVSPTIIASTFDNPNNLGVFLLATVPVLLHVLENARAPAARASLVVFIALVLLMSVLTTSRVAVYGILLIGALYLLRRPHITKSDVATVLILAALIVLMPATNRLLSFLASIDSRFVTTFILHGSTLIRLNLFQIGVDMTTASFGAGVGGGNYPVILANTHTYSDYFTSGIIDPHNWWIEILSEYGVIIFSAYSMFLVLLYLRQRAALKQHLQPAIRHLPLFFVAFVLSGVGPSSFINLSWQWLYLAVLVVASSNPAGPRRLQSRNARPPTRTVPFPSTH